MTLTEYFKNKLALLAEITEKDYKIHWDESLMVISEADTGRVVTSGSSIHCEHCVESLILRSLKEE